MTSTDTTKCTHALGLVRCGAEALPGTTTCAQCATRSELVAYNIEQAVRVANSINAERDAARDEARKAARKARTAANLLP